MKTMRYAAYLAAIVYLALALASYLCYPGTYSPLRNWLSDLGNSLTNTKGAVFYNAGCIMASLLLIVFYLSMSVWRTGDKVLGRLLAVAQISGVFSSLALILSAVINIGRNPSLHSRFSMFLTIGLTWFLSFANTALLRHPHFKKWIGVYGFAGAVVTFVYGVLVNTPLGERVTIGMFISYVVLLAVNARLLEEAESSTPAQAGAPK